MTIAQGIAEFMRKNLLYTVPTTVTVRIVDIDGNSLYAGSFAEIPKELLPIDIEGNVDLHDDYFYDADDDDIFECDFAIHIAGIPKDAKVATPIISTRSCPNCGGPIRKFGNCEYCGSLIVSERYAEYVS